MREPINGKVIKVFIDSANHADATLKFLMDGEKKTSYIFRGDQSIGFEYFQPGDSIIKREQSLVMEVFRDGQITA
jgi:hypothetical protein